MFKRPATLALLTVFFLALTACSTSEEDSFAGLETTFHKGKVYTATLNALNNSGASGEARVSFKGNSLTVDLQATDLLEDAVHLSHLHGFTTANTRAACPTLANDIDGDGLVNLLEGAPVYGGILVDLGNNMGSTIMDEDPYRTFDETGSGASIASIMPLNKKHIVVHGVDVNGDGELSLQKDVNGDGVIGSEDNPVLNLTETAFELTMPALCGELSVN